jgi:hypothetical protein
MNFSSTSAVATRAPVETDDALPAGDFGARLGEIHRLALSLLTRAQDVETLTDSAVLDATRDLARSTRALESLAARLAGEIDRRSAPEFGSGGLAQRTGYRTPQLLIQRVARITGREAVVAVRAGRLLAADAEDAGNGSGGTGPSESAHHLPDTATPEAEWMLPAARELAAGHLSVAAVDAIRAGLGSPDSSVSAEQLQRAAAKLCAESGECDPDKLRLLARAARDDLDARGVGIREEERRDRRSLRMFGSPDGTGRLIWSMDPETFVTVKDLFDRTTSPKLGGVRFVSDEAKEKARQIVSDARTPEQLASDTFTQLLIAGADADSRSMLGSGAPVVKIATTAKSRENREGRAYFEGNSAAVSIETAERLACNGSELQVSFDPAGRLIDAARESRLYSPRQREALAVRDGGCLFPDCSRPPSWCEAHHVKFWARDRGKTEVDNGALLCRHHHLLIHNNGWQIQQTPAGERWLIPPTNVDALQTPIAMPSKSLALRLLQLERGAERATAGMTA